MLQSVLIILAYVLLQYVSCMPNGTISDGERQLLPIIFNATISVKEHETGLHTLAAVTALHPQLHRLAISYIADVIEELGMVPTLTSQMKLLLEAHGFKYLSNSAATGSVDDILFDTFLLSQHPLASTHWRLQHEKDLAEELQHLLDPFTYDFSLTDKVVPGCKCLTQSPRPDKGDGYGSPLKILSISSVFIETAQAINELLDWHNIPSQIVSGVDIDDESLYIVFLHSQAASLPKYYILYNFERLNDPAIEESLQIPLEIAQQAVVVWDTSALRINIWRERYQIEATHVPPIPSLSMTKKTCRRMLYGWLQPDENLDDFLPFDVSFLGHLGAEREPFLDRLRAQGLSVFAPLSYNAFATQKRVITQLSKVVINLDGSAPGLCEHRLVYLASMGKAIVSQSAGDPIAVGTWSSVVKFVDDVEGFTQEVFRLVSNISARAIQEQASLNWAASQFCDTSGFVAKVKRAQDAFGQRLRAIATLKYDEYDWSQWPRDSAEHCTYEHLTSVSRSDRAWLWLQCVRSQADPERGFQLRPVLWSRMSRHLDHIPQTATLGQFVGYLLRRYGFAQIVCASITLCPDMPVHRNRIVYIDLESTEAPLVELLPRGADLVIAHAAASITSLERLFAQAREVLSSKGLIIIEDAVMYRGQIISKDLKAQTITKLEHWRKEYSFDIVGVSVDNGIAIAVPRPPAPRTARHGHVEIDRFIAELTFESLHKWLPPNIEGNSRNEQSLLKHVDANRLRLFETATGVYSELSCMQPERRVKCGGYPCLLSECPIKLPNPLVCNMSTSLVKLHAIGLGVPAEHVVACVTSKVTKFPPTTKRPSDVVSCQHSYTKSMFVLAEPTQAWDSLHYYQIIAAGAVPYFPEIDTAPPGVMPFLSRPLLKQAKALVESTHWLTAGKDMNITEYGRIACCLHKQLKAHSTSEAIARYILDATNNGKAKSALVLGSNTTDVMRDLILHGFRTLFGPLAVDFPSEVPPLFRKDASLESPPVCGDPFASPLQDDDHVIIRHLLTDKIICKYFDVIIYPSVHRATPFLDIVKQHYPKEKIIFIDGEEWSDFDAARNTPGAYLNPQWRELLSDGQYFKREMPRTCPRLDSGY